MGLGLSTLDKPACPYCGSNANERFGLNLEYDQCALIPTNSGSNKCVLINGSYNPPLTKIARDKPWFGCSVHTEKNIIRFAKRSEKLEKTSQEIQIKAYEECGMVEILPPGIAIGAIETFVDNRYFAMKITPLGGDGRTLKN